MANRLRLYFDQPIDERMVKGLLNQEFDSGVVDLIKVDVDKRGDMYALVNADPDIPLPVFDMLGNRRISVSNVVKEKQDSFTSLIIKEDVRIPGTSIILEAGEEIEILEATYKTAPEILELVVITLNRYNIKGKVEKSDRNGGVVSVDNPSNLDRSWEYVLEDLQWAQKEGTINSAFEFTWDQDGDEKVYVDDGSGKWLPEFSESTKHSSGKNLNEARAPYQMPVTHKSEDGGRTWEPVTAPEGFSIEKGSEVDPMEWQENNDGSGSFIAAKQSEENPSYYNGSIVHFDNRRDLADSGWRV